MEAGQMEKIINKIKIIETDDGYRIEIKGNKEAIHRMLSGFGPFNFHGKGAPFGRGFGFGFGPGCWGGWWNPWEEPEKEKSGEQ
jgi:hypothetical protein